MYEEMTLVTSKVHLIMFNHSAIFTERLSTSDVESSRFLMNSRRNQQDDKKSNLMIHHVHLLYETPKRMSQILPPNQKYNAQKIYLFSGALPRCWSFTFNDYCCKWWSAPKAAKLLSFNCLHWNMISLLLQWLCRFSLFSLIPLSLCNAHLPE